MILNLIKRIDTFIWKLLNRNPYPTEKWNDIQSYYTRGTERDRYIKEAIEEAEKEFTWQ